MLDTARLEGVASLRLAHTLLSILGHSWVHLEPSRPASRLPRPLALPWTRVASRLGLRARADKPQLTDNALLEAVHTRRMEPSHQELTKISEQCGMTVIQVTIRVCLNISALSIFV